MTVSEIKKALSEPQGAYLFYGEEEYLKHHFLSQVRDTLIPDATFDAFNRVVLSGKEGISDLAGAIALPPVMTDRKLIELHEVQYSALTSKELEGLCEMLDQAVGDGTSVVILYATEAEVDAPNPKRPPAYLRTLSEHALPICFSYQDQRRLVTWIAGHFSREGIRVRESDCVALIDYCTRDMTALSNEISKLCAYLHAHSREELAREDIPYICCRIDEIAAFDFTNAILEGKRARAYEILKDMVGKKQRPEQILGSIAGVWEDLYRIRTLHESGMSLKAIASALGIHEYRVTVSLRALGNRPTGTLIEALDACARADRLLKSSTLPSFGVLSGLVLGR